MAMLINQRVYIYKDINVIYYVLYQHNSGYMKNTIP
jgi:hypothetical protein